MSEEQQPNIVEAFGLDGKLTLAHKVDYVWHQLKLQDKRTSELADAVVAMGGRFVASSSWRSCLKEHSDLHVGSFDFVLYAFEEDGSAIALPEIWSRRAIALPSS